MFWDKQDACMYCLRHALVLTNGNTLTALWHPGTQDVKDNETLSIQPNGRQISLTSMPSTESFRSVFRRWWPISHVEIKNMRR